MIICIVYVINAIISPICILPLSIFFAPNQTIRTLTPFITSIIIGIINVITLFVNNCVPVRSLLAASNLFSSSFSLPKALITNTPVNISLEIRFNLSIRDCIILNLGIAIPTNIITRLIKTTTASTIIQFRPVFVFNTFVIPPIARIGAYNTILKNNTVTICIC